MKKSMGAIALLMTLALALTGCNNEETPTPNEAGEAAEGEVIQQTEGAAETGSSNTNGGALDNVLEGYSSLPQFQEPADDAIVAVIKTSLGEIQAVLFPEAAPLTVENFTTHASNGYYDGVIFHRVIPDFMIQTGDPEGTGMGGESIWGDGFKDEFHPLFHHYKGALSMAKGRHDQNGSQFFIVQAGPLDENYVNSLSTIAEDGAGQEFPNRSTGEMDSVDVYLSEEAIKAYGEVGGTPHLDYGLAENQHSVFGQVIRGIDVVDAIAAVEIGGGDRPATDVVIESITICTYGDVK